MFGQSAARRKPVIDRWINSLSQSGHAFPPETIGAELVMRILRAAVLEGGDMGALLSAARLDETRLRNPLGRLSASKAIQLFGALQSQFGDPTIALRLGGRAGALNFSDPGYPTRLRANLAEVIQANVQFQAFRTNMFEVAFDTGVKPPVLGWRVPPGKAEIYAPSIEFSVSAYTRLPRHILGEPALLRSVDFQHAARFDPQVYADMFGCPVRFSMPQTRVEMVGRQLFRASPVANAALFEMAMERYRRPALWLIQGLKTTAHGYFYLSNTLDKTPPALNQMAASFGTTERSLRRRLVNEGYSFRELLDMVRQDLSALYLMENRRPLGEVARLLGYSDLSTYSRAHNRWHGSPPSKMETSAGENVGGRSLA